MTSRTFEGKIAFVTGATSGIGQGVALAFAREGATVIGCGRNAPRGAETQRLVEAEGGAFLFLPMDLGDAAQVAGAVRVALDRYGRLDCAANCAGVDVNAGFLDYTAADFDQIFGTNVRGLFLCLREEVGAMRRGGGDAVGGGGVRQVGRPDQRGGPRAGPYADAGRLPRAHGAYGRADDGGKPGCPSTAGRDPHAQGHCRQRTVPLLAEG